MEYFFNDANMHHCFGIEKYWKDASWWIICNAYAYEGSETDCDDPLIALACSTDSDACPAECKEGGDDEDKVVKSGDLAVSAKAATNKKVIVPGSGNNTTTVSDMDTLTFKTSEEVEITKVILERYGYSTNDDVENVWLEDEEGNIISNKASLNTKGQANLTIKKDYRKVDGTYNATIVLEVATGVVAGKTIGFKVVDVESTAKNLDLGDYSPYTYDTVVYGGAAVTFTVRWTTKDYNIEAGKSYEVSKFKVKAPSDSAILVKGFTLTNLAGTKYCAGGTAVPCTGTYDYMYTGLKQLDVEKYLDEIIVKVDGKEAKASANINKDDELVISFNNDVEISAKANVEFTVEASFTEGFDAYESSIIYAIAEWAHFNAIDAKTESRVSMPTDREIAAYSWPTYTFKWGKVKLTNTKLGSIDGALDSSDVVIAEGSITVAETIKGDLEVTVSGTPNGTITAMRLQVSGDEYEGKENTTDKWTFKNVEIDESWKIKLLVDITDKDTIGSTKVEWQTFTFTVNGWNQFHYTEGKTNDTVDIAGSISPSKLTIQPAKASLTNTLSKVVEFRNKESNRKVVFDWVYTAKKWALKLNEFIISGAAVSTNTGVVTFYLIVDGDEVADAQLNSNGQATSTFSNIEIDADASVSIVVEAEVNASNGTGSLGKYELSLKWEDENGNPAGNAKKNTVELKVVELGSITVNTSSSEKKTVLRKSSNVTLAQFTVKPSNSSSEVDLEKIEFTLTWDNVGSLNNDDITLTIDNVTEDWDTASNQKWTYAPTVTLDSDGVVIKVELNEELTGTVTLTGLKVNDKDQSSNFSKRFEEAIVRIVKQEDMWGTTKFTVEVDADSDVTVSDFMYGTGKNTATLTWIAGNINDGDTFEVKWIRDEVQLIESVTYKINWKALTAQINKDDFNDFFKVGDTYAKVFQSNSK